MASVMIYLYFLSPCSFARVIPSSRVKSGNFGHQVNSDSDLVRFIFKLLE